MPRVTVRAAGSLLDQRSRREEILTRARGMVGSRDTADPTDVKSEMLPPRGVPMVAPTNTAGHDSGSEGTV